MATKEQLYELCQRVVQKLLHKYGWRLLEEERFAQTVFERTTAEGLISEKDIIKIAINEYSKAFYEATSSSADPENYDKLNQAYNDLCRYLYSLACSWRPDRPEDAEDAVQKALVDIFEKSAQCRCPGAFLAFCIGKLRGAFTWTDRQKGKDSDPSEQDYRDEGRSRARGRREPVYLEELFADYQEDESALGWESRLENESAILPEGSLETQEEQMLLSEAVTAELRRKFQKHPRAVRQFRAIILDAFGYGHQEIADSLDASSLNAASSLKSRGAKLLRNNRELRELYARMLSE